MQTNYKERIEYIKRGEIPPDTNQRKKKFAKIFLLINIVVFILLVSLLFQKKEHSEYVSQTVAINDVQVRVALVHSLNKPIIASIQFTSSNASQLKAKNPFITVMIFHETTAIVAKTVPFNEQHITITPHKPATFTISIDSQEIIQYAKKHDLLKPKRYVYHSIIPLIAKCTIHTLMDYSISIPFSYKVSGR